MEEVIKEMVINDREIKHMYNGRKEKEEKNIAEEDMESE